VRFPVTVAEVPFQFQARHSGASKADTREGLRFARLLLDLRLRRLQRLWRFLVVGGSGLIVNQVLLALFTELFGLHYLISAVIATQGSTGWNFILTDIWVFHDRTARRSALARFIQSALMNNLLLLGRGPLLVLLTAGLGIHYLTSNLITLVALFALRFAVSDRWIWAEDTTQPTFNYDIHGILRISSEAPLPELGYFRTQHNVADPDLRVRVGGPRRRRGTHAGQDDGVFRYSEALGRLERRQARRLRPDRCARSSACSVDPLFVIRPPNQGANTATDPSVVAIPCVSGHQQSIQHLRVATGVFPHRARRTGQC
jgi:putative flippase GtrA